MSYLEVKKLCKSFDQTKVLNGVNLSVEQYQQCSIVGASGSGKSTLLYLLGGLDKPSAGKVSIEDKQIDLLSDDDLSNFRNSYIGFVFQFHFLLPSMRCFDNMMLPCEIGSFKKKEIKKRVVELSERLGVSHCLKKYPYQISGGEQQRVSIVRALSLRPKLLLCDEPTGNLDSQNSENVITVLRQMAKDEGATLLVVTHDQNIANQFERKITIEDGLIIS
jgi:lipoprotein-releasing system ATP-binding protein